MVFIVPHCISLLCWNSTVGTNADMNFGRITWLTPPRLQQRWCSLNKVPRRRSATLSRSKKEDPQLGAIMWLTLSQGADVGSSAGIVLYALLKGEHPARCNNVVSPLVGCVLYSCAVRGRKGTVSRSSLEGSFLRVDMAPSSRGFLRLNEPCLLNAHNSRGGGAHQTFILALIFASALCFCFCFCA